MGYLWVCVRYPGHETVQELDVSLHFIWHVRGSLLIRAAGEAPRPVFLYSCKSPWHFVLFVSGFLLFLMAQWREIRAIAAEK